MAKLSKLTCLVTHGRWNKGDKASFDPKTAEKLTAGENPKWSDGKQSAPAETA